MEIRRIKASDLLEFAEKAASFYEGSIPITPWRADSQVKNPFSNPDDILLIVAGEAKKLLGYIGILPGIEGKNSGKRLFWNSCWWVAPESGAIVSMSLLNEFMKITGKQIAFSDLSERTWQIIDKLGFKVKKREGVLLNIRSGLHSRTSNKKKTDLKSRILVFTRSFGLFRLLDLFLNFIRPVGLKLEKNMNDIDIQKLYIPDEESYSFIEENSENGITVPNEQHFSWWQSSPWLVKETKASKALFERYYFSSLTKDFEIYLVKVKRGKDILGIAVLSSREGVIKTQYLWYKSGNANDFFHALCKQITDSTINHRIITFHEDFSNYLISIVKYKSQIRNLKRYTAISPLISEKAKDYQFQDGDGDYIFT